MAKRPLAPADINLFRHPGDPQVSPDGRWVVWTQQTPDINDDTTRSDIWLAPADGATPGRPLTSSGRDRLARWSPDGGTIAFISDRTGRAQLWLIHPDGGEAWHLPTEQTVATAPAWAPDGSSLAFTAKVFSHDGDWQPYAGSPAGDRERAAAQAHAQEQATSGKAGDKGGGTASAKSALQSDVAVVTRLGYRFDGIGYHGDRRSQVFVVAVAGPGDATVPAAQVTNGDYDHRDPVWLPDGSGIVLAAARRADADWTPGGELWAVSPAGAKLKLLFRGSGPVVAPAVSPDGQWLAFLGNDFVHQGSTTNSVWVIPLGEGAGETPLGHDAAHNLTAAADRPAGCGISSDIRYTLDSTPPQWAADSSSIYHLLTDGGQAKVVQLPVPGGPGTVPAVVVGSAGRVVAGLSLGGGTLAFQAETPVCPSEIFACPVARPAAEVRLSRANDQLLAELELADSRPLRYAGADGWPIDGFLMLPPGGGDKLLPLVLFIHGGPHGVYGASFNYQFQTMAAAGCAVLYTNPRGSQGYGQDFARAVAGDWGGRDYQDIMSGVDHVVEAGIADPQRLGVTGWSYGGFMTSWTVTQTNRFRAAVAGAVIYNRLNFWGTSDIGTNFGTWQMGGTPWEQEAVLLERSPSRYVDRVVTPLLLLGGESDLRCPIEQGEQFYQALRYRGQTAVLVRYPGEYHTFRKPSHRQDRFGRMRAWFEHYLMG